MKSIKLAFIAMAVLPLLSLFGCEIQSPDQNEPKTENKDNQETSTDNQKEETSPTDGKILVVYYSYTGNCSDIVSSISNNIKADVLRIKEVNESADYNANNYKLGSDLISAINSAPGQASSYPEIKSVDKKAEDYDTIIVVTPLWHARMAAIMQTYLFLNGAKMKGKNVGLVVSSASSSISGVESDAKRLVPEGNFYSSLWINNSNRSKRADLVKEWLEKNNIK